MKRYVHDPAVSQQFRSLYKEINKKSGHNQYNAFKQMTQSLKKEDERLFGKHYIRKVKDDRRVSPSRKLSPIQQTRKSDRRNKSKNIIQSQDTDPYKYMTLNPTEAAQTKPLQ